MRCHRRLVAEWLEEKLGIVVPELATNVPNRFPSVSSTRDGTRNRVLVRNYRCCFERRSSKVGRWPLGSEMQVHGLPARPNQPF